MGGHTGDASGDDNDVGVLERGLSAVVGRQVASRLLQRGISKLVEPRGNGRWPLLGMEKQLTAADEM